MNLKRKIITSLADLRQDYAGTVPVDIVKKWVNSQKNDQAQEEVLRPYEKIGYLVSTDSAGLSRLTSERSLLEVMKIVSEPKEIIFEMGKKIGGRGVGIWAADNSEMFYEHKDVDAVTLLNTMASAQKIINQGLLQVGMGIHKATFWEIGLNMFGKEAELLGVVAENFTEGKEILISEAVKNELNNDWHDKLSYREDLKEFERGFYTLNYNDLGDAFENFILPDFSKLEKGQLYPLPFSRQFFLMLKQMGVNRDAELALQNLYQNKIVILVKVHHKEEKLLLDQLTDWVVVNAIIHEVADKYNVELIKSNGDLGIFIADSDSEAIEFAEDLFDTLNRGNDQVAIGVCRGDVLIFDLDDGGRDIAGGAVNVASKISEDISDKNALYIEKSVKLPINHHHKYTEFSMNKSNVVIEGVCLCD